MNELTQKYVRSLFDYRDGELYWKKSRGKAKIGDLVGSNHGNGYRRVGIDYKRYFIHRLIFLWHHGYLPDYIDHIDRDKSNNEISNLREVTKSQNGMNGKKTKSHNGKPTTSSYMGVYRHKQAGKWITRITIKGKQIYYRAYDSEIEAAKAHDRAAKELCGEFASLNFPD